MQAKSGNASEQTPLLVDSNGKPAVDSADVEQGELSVQDTNTFESSFPSPGNAWWYDSELPWSSRLLFTWIRPLMRTIAAKGTLSQVLSCLLYHARVLTMHANL